MRWQYEERNEDDLVNNIENFLWQRDMDDDRHQNLTLGKFDNEPYRELLKGEIPDDQQSQIKKAADFFSGKIRSCSYEEMDNLRKYLLSSMNLVMITCESEESAFRLFETLNDRGLELSAIDLMKNFLFKHASRDANIDYGNIRSNWESIISIIRYELDQPRRFFIHSLLSFEDPDIQDSITQYTLYDTFKNTIEEKIPSSDLTIELYLEKMADSASLYVDIVNATVDKYGEEANQKINSILDDLSNHGYTQERILLFRAFRDIENANKIIRILRLVETFIVRRRITDSITGSKVNELHAELCSEVFDQDNIVEYLKNRLSDRSPDDDIFVASIKNKDFTLNSQTLYYLKKVELNYYQNDSERSLSSGEIEHIAPRKAFTAKKYSPWPDYLATSEEEFDNYKDKIGNLTILEQRINAEAQNNPFEQKKEVYVESEFKMAQHLLEVDRWSLSMIQQRTEELAEAAGEIWNFEY
jgi:uncharacterized protein with ParB-like and HNH nuclease domain